MNTPPEFTFFKRLSMEYGKDCLNLIRKLERTGLKIARYKQHLTFTIRCKENNIFPRSLCLKTSMYGYKSRIIIERAQKALICERIRQILFTLSILREKFDRSMADLAGSVPYNEYLNIREFLEKCFRRESTTCKQRQISKFDRLVEKEMDKILKEGEKEYLAHKDTPNQNDGTNSKCLLICLNII